MFLKNQAGQWIGFCLIAQADGNGLPGLMPLPWVSRDGGVAALGGGPLRDRGNGQYAYGPTQGESNCNALSVILTATGAVPMEKTVYPFDLAAGIIGVFAYTIGAGVPFGPNNLIEVSPNDGLLWDNAGGGSAWLRLQNAGPTQTGSVSTAAQTFAGDKTFTGVVASLLGFSLPHTVLSETPGAFGFTHAEAGLTNLVFGFSSQAGFVNCVLTDLNGGATLPRFGLQVNPTAAVFGKYGTLTDGTEITGGLVTGIGAGVLFASILGLPTTLAGYGINTPIGVTDGGTGLAATGADGDVLTALSGAWVSSPPSGGGTAHGTYTPTLTNTGNVLLSSTYSSPWSQVGDVVTVSGRIDLTLNASSVNTSFTIDLPVPSNFANSGDCCGTAVWENSGSSFSAPVTIFGDPVAHQASFNLNTPVLTTMAVSFTFTYQVVP
jgi:hypothetical protein